MLESSASSSCVSLPGTFSGVASSRSLPPSSGSALPGCLLICEYLKYSLCDDVAVSGRLGLGVSSIGFTVTLSSDSDSFSSVVECFFWPVRVFCCLLFMTFWTRLGRVGVACGSFAPFVSQSSGSVYFF